MSAARCDIPSVCLITLGCAKNEVDSQKMASAIREAGYLLCEEPEGADAVIVNTCAFIRDALEESIDEIFGITELDSYQAGETKLIVAGCMPARYGQDLSDELSEADAFVPCAEEPRIVRYLEELIGPGCPTDMQADDLRSSNRPASAYVKISDGCNRFCSYCAIPYIRGRYHSYPFEQVSADVEDAISRGAGEIVLIAQDTGAWGSDFLPPETLASLLDRLASRHPGTWFRVMYLEPDGISDELLSVIAHHANICNYLDIPLQHVDEGLLSAMNRSGNREAFEELFERIRIAVPDIALRTTLIAGFPGETDEQFEELCDFVESADLDYVGVFAFSPEEGTKAAELPGQVDEEERTERAQQLRDLADALSIQKVSERIGKTMDVLVEGTEEDGQLFGRAMCQAPEVDGAVYLDKGEIGSIVSVEIIDSLFYEMEGTVI